MGGEGGNEIDCNIGVRIGDTNVIGEPEKGCGGGIGVGVCGGGGGDLVERVVVCDEGGSSGGEGTGGLTAAICGVGDGGRGLSGGERIFDLCKTKVQIVSSKFGWHCFFFCVCVNFKNGQ